MEQNGCVVLFSYSRVDYLLGINLVNSGDLWAGDRLEGEREEKREQENILFSLFSFSTQPPKRSKSKTTQLKSWRLN